MSPTSITRPSLPRALRAAALAVLPLLAGCSTLQPMASDGAPHPGSISFKGWQPTGSELNREQKAAVLEAIALIRRAGYDSDARYLEKELREGDIEAMDPCDPDLRGFCWRFLGGEWITIAPRYLKSSGPDGTAFDRFDPCIVTLAMILVHEAQHAAHAADELKAYTCNVEFADALLEKFQDCFGEAPPDARAALSLRLADERGRAVRKKEESVGYPALKALR